MANVLFKRGVQAQLPQSGAIDGAFYLTTDTHRLYYGNSSGTCDLLSQAIIEVATVADLANQPLAEGQFYYVTGSNILAIRHNNAWVQINPDTKVVQNNGTSLTEFNTSEGTGVDAGKVSVSLNIAQSRADAAIQSDVTAGFDIEGAGSITVSANPTTDVVTITGALLDVAEYLENSEHRGASITLGSSQVDLKEGNNISITHNNDTITIAGTDNYVNSATITSDYARNNGNGFEIGATLGRTGSLGNVTATYTTIDPVIDYGFDGMDQNENPETSASAHFVNGHAVLDVYTRAEVDELVDTSLYELNAMTYKGTVGSAQADRLALPTLTDNPASIIRIGDTWLADSNIEVDGTVYPAGTMFVANGTETNGVITDDLAWSAVQTSDRDTHYKGDSAQTTYGGKLDIVTDDSSQNIVATTKIESGANLSSNDTTRSVFVTASKSGTIDQEFTVQHKAYTAGSSTGSYSQASAGTNSSVTYVSNITTENGHITNVEKTTATITNTYTEVSDVTVTAGGITGQDNGATVTTAVTTADAGGTISNTESGAFTINSSSLAVSGSSSAVVVNLEWGSFPSNS